MLETRRTPWDVYHELKRGDADTVLQMVDWIRQLYGIFRRLELVGAGEVRVFLARDLFVEDTEVGHCASAASYKF